jgi:hypothetical protein
MTINVCLFTFLRRRPSVRTKLSVRSWVLLVLRAGVSDFNDLMMSRVWGSSDCHDASVVMENGASLRTASVLDVAKIWSTWVLVVMVGLDEVGTPTSRSSSWSSSTCGPGVGCRDNMSGPSFLTPGTCIVRKSKFGR